MAFEPHFPPFNTHPSSPSPAYEPAVDLWPNTTVMEIPSTYSPKILGTSKGLYVDGISMAVVLDHRSTAQA